MPAQSAPRTDKEGYLVNLDEWSPEIAIILAEECNIELLESHWEIIHLLRGFHEKFELSPPMRILVKQVKSELGAEKGNSIYLMKLFPPSPAKIAAKIAGLPRPTNCL